METGRRERAGRDEKPTATRVGEVLMGIFTSLCAGTAVCLASENQRGALEVRGVRGVELWRLWEGHCVQECCEVEEMLR